MLEKSVFNLLVLMARKSLKKIKIHKLKYFYSIYCLLYTTVGSCVYFNICNIR